MRRGMITILLCMMAIFNVAQAQMLPFKLGVRVGVNTANQGINMDKVFPDVKKGNTEWKAGYEFGAVADVEIGRMFALQPGFFFQSHGYNYVITSADMNGGSLSALKTGFGSTRYTNIQIPLLASVRIPIMSNVQWQIDAGPYVSYGFGGHNNMESYSTKQVDGQPTATVAKYSSGFFEDSDGEMIGNCRFDWGLKFGMGLKLHDHYYVGIHYNAGCRNVGKNHENFVGKPQVKNKSWVFSVGYDF